MNWATELTLWQAAGLMAYLSVGLGCAMSFLEFVGEKRSARHTFPAVLLAVAWPFAFIVGISYAIWRTGPRKPESTL